MAVGFLNSAWNTSIQFFSFFIIFPIGAALVGALAVSGLYLCGEALDVDAPCGGYNLHWAWSSGLLAGLSIARDLNLLKRKTPPVPFESADARRKDGSCATDPAWRIAASALERESA